MTERQLPSWYPKGVNHIIDLKRDPTPYGPPEPETMAVIDRRLMPAPARVLDIPGGYGKFAIPLAEAGYDVTIVDISESHLAAAERNIANLPEGAGHVETILADVTEDREMSELGSDYDASLCMAFLYLPPPEIAIEIFCRYAPLHRIGGLAVVQFFTNIERRDTNGKPLIGEKEYRYSLEEGIETLETMFEQAGFGNLEIDPFVIRDEAPYFLHTDALTASAIKI